ncbi:MAG: primosomal protein N' [Desulfobulbaceae bacterium]|jgi:primosomal protein N' (replication factor Y)|nr:primosomal protein N' [Desulfobulbaceae bacterium]
MSQAVEVAVAAPLPRTLTYLIKGQSAENLIGRRAIVPLGNRRLTGYILAVLPEIPQTDFTIKEVIALPDATPLFHAGQIPLFRWLADYYHYPIGEVIATAMPAGLNRKSAKRLELVEDNKAVFDAPEADFPWWPKLKEQGSLSARESKEILKSAAGKKTVARLVASGVIRLRQELTGRKQAEKWQVFYHLNSKNQPGIFWDQSLGAKPEATAIRAFFSRFPASLANTLAALSPRAVKTLFFFHKLATGAGADGAVSRAALRQAYGPALSATDELIAQGLIDEERRLAQKNLFGEEITPASNTPFTLSDEQARVTYVVSQAMDAGGFSTFLLHGVTGGGKTEVYLRLVAKCLAMGKSALVLVPEIALATQLEEYFLARFASQVALLHSGLSDSERLEQWTLAATGEKRLVIGARSAVFAPLKNLGLIVVDEEHDGGFKQDDGLRYHGRDVAVMRGKLEKTVVLLASATPSVQSAYNAQIGKYRLLTMNSRVGGGTPPPVTVLNLADRIRQGGKGRRLFLPPLVEALRDNLTRGKQSVLLLNRRGFSTSIVCQECGAPVECVNCRVSLTLHKSQGQLLCHYCGFHLRPDTICAHCGSMALARIGFGVERVEEEARQLFPQARIARVDTDTARDRRLFLAILRQMKAGEIDILVGTQMVAKGHHFPGVTLVGVVWADGGLGLPDFRAGEKTFQLLTQVIGRAGRGDAPGQVFIQTFRPDHYAIAYARDNRYDLLLAEELGARQNPLFPPYTRLALAHIQGEDEEATSKSALEVARFCRAHIKQNSALELLGPMPAPIERLRRKYRRQIVMKSADATALHQLLSRLTEAKNSLIATGCSLALDVDPENML